MRVGNFSVIIPQGRERQTGHVEMVHGRVYTIKLVNHWYDRDCDAKVEIDGKDVGCFRVYGSGSGSVTLERPVNDSRCFTFYRSDSSEAFDAGIHDVHEDTKGLVKVLFKPEIKRRYEREEKTSGGMRHLGEYRETPLERFRSANGAGGQHCNSSPRRLISGITGLSGQSGQRFNYVPPLDYDPSEEVTIHLRLGVEEGSDVRPLRASGNSPGCANSVPPPLV